MANPSAKQHPEDGGVWIVDERLPQFPYHGSFLNQSRTQSPVGGNLALSAEPQQTSSFLHFLNKLPPTTLALLHPDSPLETPPTSSSTSFLQPHDVTDAILTMADKPKAAPYLPPHLRPKNRATKKTKVLIECDPKSKKVEEHGTPKKAAATSVAAQKPWKPVPLAERRKPTKELNVALHSSDRGRGRRGRGGRARDSGEPQSTKNSEATFPAPNTDQWHPEPLEAKPKPLNPTNMPFCPADRGRGRGRGGGPRVRGRGGFGDRSDQWAKPKDIDTSRWDIHWDSASEPKSNSISSCWADGGIAFGAKKRAANGEEGHKITDWAGNWAPAPIDWDSRPAFRESQSASLISGWLDVIQAEFGEKPRAICLDKNRTLEGHLAPRYWIPDTIGTDTLKDFWHEILTSDEPEPEDHGDLDGVKPWWLAYKSPQLESEMIEPYQHKWEEVGIDPAAENQFERAARNRDKGGATATVRRKNIEKEKKATRRKREQGLTQATRNDRGMTASDLPVGLKSDIKLYIRPACNDDLNAVTEIYNHYVEFTTCVPEIERLTIEIWQDRFKKALTRNLPFLVAYKRGDRVPPPKKRPYAEAIILPDTLVGFACAKDYDPSGQPNMYEPTVEIEVYTHSMHPMKGVARCLLDQLLGQIDSTYTPTPSYMFTAEFDPDLDDFVPGGLPMIDRKIKNILVKLPYERQERLERVGTWLHRAFAFEEKGMLAGIGVKSGKTINMAIFQRACNPDTVQ